jgi:DNA-binding NtrC family response regulator
MIRDRVALSNTSVNIPSLADSNPFSTGFRFTPMSIHVKTSVKSDTYKNGTKGASGGVMDDAQHDPFLNHFLPGEGRGMQELRATIAKINRRYKNPPRMGRSILLRGETGVGKNHVARVIAGHLYWLRDPGCWTPPSSESKSTTLLQVTAEHFAEVALPNLPSELIESELFGHVKGAFTGATSDKEGYFCADYIEDLLLDEVGDAPAALQAKLLQVLNDGGFKRLGADPGESRVTDARIILATNRDLAADVREGRFRADLYWRIQNLVVLIPPLREQAERIPALAQSIVRTIVRDAGAPANQFRLSPADLAWAKSQQWPGNVRELERLLWRWVYEGGEKTLREIQDEYPDETVHALTHGPSIADFVRAAVVEALERNARLASSVGGFSRSVERDVQISLYRLKDELFLDHRALSTLFGDGERAAKQISAWGEGVRSR